VADQGVEVGPIVAARGTSAFGFVPVATGADGGELGIAVHVMAGIRPGPRVVVMSTSHGNEIRQIAALQRLAQEISCEDLTGDLVLVPVQNPVAFEMGVRSTWMDSMWGDNGNMNRLWPGRANGWITERFTHTITSQILPGSTVVMDLHGSTTEMHASYGYLGIGHTGDLDYDVARVFGQAILAWNSTAELEEKKQTTGTAMAAARIGGYAAYGGEIGEFFGLATNGHDSNPDELHQLPHEIGFTGVTNVMKHLGMLKGDVMAPRRQISVTPELNLRPTHGGLLESKLTARDIGTVVPKGTLLGSVVSPYSFKLLEEIRAPFEASFILGAHHQPLTKVLPGEYGYIVADDARTEVLT
jgi:predicted deacylase